MALRVKVLRKKAEKFEAKQLQIYKIDKEKLSSLEPLLQEVVSIMRPKPNEYKVRRDLVRVFNDISKEIYGNSQKSPVVVEFGSFVMDLFVTTSDLDLSVNFNSNEAVLPKEKKIQTLRKFAKKLYSLQSKGHVYGVFPITTAKVPIVKVVDRGTGVECDISVENRDGILKSKIIHIVSQIDGRFHNLSFLMKIWAKAHNINSSKNKTLNSLSIILLVAFHLQTRNPPILPPFSAIFKDGTAPETVLKSVTSYVGFGKNNNESLAELFVTLLIKLHSVENLWGKGICASTCEASWISRTWNSKVAYISVEDFTDRSENVARAVGRKEVKRINKCIEVSIGHVFSFMDGKFGGLALKELLFGTKNIRVSSPKENSSLLPFTMAEENPELSNGSTLPSNSSQSNPSTAVVIGKKRKLQTTTSVVNKKAAVKTQNSTPVNCGKPMTSWGWTYSRTQQQPMAGSWSGAQVADKSGGSSQLPITNGYVGAQLPTAGVWRAVQPPPRPGGWGISQQPMVTGFRGSLQPNVGDWVRAQLPTTTSWEEAMQPATRIWEADPQQPATRVWVASPQQPATRSWEEAQQPATRPWGGVPYYLWTNPNTRDF